MKQVRNADKKFGKSLFHGLEQKLIHFFVAKIPKSIETYHLTLLTIPWCLGIIGMSYLAQNNIAWLWGVSIMIFFQYLTDLFDGAVGRFRKTGLILWGYYMDHFLDYIFLCSILIGYAILLPPMHALTALFVLSLFGAFMVNSFLSFSVTSKFRIAYMKIGPTEMRLTFIIINTLLIIFGKTHMVSALPYILIFSLIGLCIVVYRAQAEIWKIDMKNKTKK